MAKEQAEWGTLRPDRFWNLRWGKGHFQLHLQDDYDQPDHPALYLEFEEGDETHFDVSVSLDLADLEALEALLPQLKRFLVEGTLPEGRRFVGTSP